MGFAWIKVSRVGVGVEEGGGRGEHCKLMVILVDDQTSNNFPPILMAWHTVCHFQLNK